MTDDEFDGWRLNEKGVEVAQQAVELFKQGLSHEQIAERLGLSDGEATGTEAVQVLIALAELQGVFD